MVIGACIQGVGDEAIHPPPDRKTKGGLVRSPGWGGGCQYDKMLATNATLVENNMYPLFSAADFRRNCGIQARKVDTEKYSEHSAFHFHNWFSDPYTIRQKYLTYGHPDKNAFRKHLKDLHSDMALLNQCAMNDTTLLINQKDDILHQPHGASPIYFHDEEYRKKRLSFIKYMIELDESSGHGAKIQQWNHSNTNKHHLPIRSHKALGHA